MPDYSMFVSNVRFELIPIKDLVSSQIRQRNLSQNHVNHAVVNFDPLLVNPIKVSRRNGVNFVFVGQFTIEIIALVTGSRDTLVWCMIYDGLNYEVEADIFANHEHEDKYPVSYGTMQNKALTFLFTAMKEES